LMYGDNFSSEARRRRVSGLCRRRWNAQAGNFVSGRRHDDRHIPVSSLEKTDPSCVVAMLRICCGFDARAAHQQERGSSEPPCRQFFCFGLYEPKLPSLFCPVRRQRPGHSCLALEGCWLSTIHDGSDNLGGEITDSDQVGATATTFSEPGSDRDQRSGLPEH